ncbi:hypothetical protein CERSUDRAFT_119181 [Gelatoporia subvermispora B]|uniref:Uncharacterized protein n=1 Tax=Ceriporiopsis subvermispora (strain B) TaxID=914234 RepID=M2R0X1_CERS8|nr:hypothetical protein CERSUDRAFT_119181 [Gelatoporia subvermispora B]
MADDRETANEAQPGSSRPHGNSDKPVLKLDIDKFSEHDVHGALHAFYHHFGRRIGGSTTISRGTADPIPAAAVLCIKVPSSQGICPFNGWACPVDNTFGSRDDFVKHIQLHFTRTYRPAHGRQTYDKPKILCLFCGTTASREDALKRHVNDFCMSLPRQSINDEYIQEKLEALVLEE